MDMNALIQQQHQHQQQQQQQQRNLQSGDGETKPTVLGGNGVVDDEQPRPRSRSDPEGIDPIPVLDIVVFV
jgi:hypothetical protein